MNQREFIRRVAAATGISFNQCQRVYKAILREGIEVLSEGSELSLLPLCKFAPKYHPPRPITTNLATAKNRSAKVMCPAKFKIEARVAPSANRKINEALNDDLE